jgi:hypothetical protein
MNAKLISKDMVDNAPDVDLMGPCDYEAMCEIAPHLFHGYTYAIGFEVASYFQTSYSGNPLEKDVLFIKGRNNMDARSKCYRYDGTIPGAVIPILNWDIQQIQ